MLAAKMVPLPGSVSHSPTPLVPVQLAPHRPVIWAKLEYLNPSGSAKDRIARFILEKAWREGRIGPGSTVIEASSGSTSIAMALKFLAVMPEGVSNERVAAKSSLPRKLRASWGPSPKPNVLPQSAGLFCPINSRTPTTRSPTR